MSNPRREHPRRRRLLRRPPVVQHPPDPTLNLAADVHEDLPVPGRPDLTWPDLELAAEPIGMRDVSRETSGRPDVDAAAVAALQEAPPAAPPLSREAITRLEALTAQWARDVRIGGPGPDDTLLVPDARTLPPVPPARRPTPLEEVPVSPHPDTGAWFHQAGQEPPPLDLEAPPARVFGWASRHDPRSLAFAAQSRLAHPVPLQDFQLELGPILDQGTTPPLSLHDASACTGMAAAAAANILELGSTSEYAAGRHAQGLLDEDDARALYLEAQRRDGVPGEDYAGTSVLAVMQAGQAAGYWDTYLWAIRGTRDIAQCLLQLRAPVVLGIPWTAGMEEPDARGIIRPTGPAAGGHALCAVGIRRQVTGAEPGPFFVLQQSRGAAEGLGGRVLLHHAHLSKLLAGVGEAGVPLPRWGLT